MINVKPLPKLFFVGGFTSENKKYGKRFRLTTYVTSDVLGELKQFADPDDGDRWEAPLLRKIIRGWLTTQTGGLFQALQGQKIEGVGPLKVAEPTAKYGRRKSDKKKTG